ncbi:MAG: outer membrane beta-barrel protein [Rikenellaceae bacterium]
MKRSLLLFFLLFVISSSVVAQTTSRGKLNLRLVDSGNNDAMVGAVVGITNDGKGYYYNTTDGSGAVSFPNTEYGKYQLTATYVGYDTIRRSITIDRDLVDLGSLKMSFRSKTLARVEVQSNAIRTSQSGDTVIYNADAFKVAADAVAEGLLAKMPGIKVDDGEVEAQGEEVKKVYLDGKEFFSEDVTIAMKNIPADIIARVEVFNKLSDEAEFTGFDDGNSYKAINIVTRTGMNKGQFGKFTAGYAHEGLYQLSANYNYFTSTGHRFSVIASSNNMNIKGFGAMSVGGGRGGAGGGRMMTSGVGSFESASAGLSTSSGVGLNYGGELLDSKLKINASYFFNTTENEIEKSTDRQYITDVDELQRFYTSTSNSETDNYNHRVNAMIEYKPNKRHTIMMRPSFVYQDNGSWNYSDVLNEQSLDGLTREELSQTISDVTSQKDAYSVSNNLVYRALLGNKGRNIMLTASGSYSVNDNTSLSYISTYYPEADESVTNQDIINDTESYSVSSSVTYSEPIFNKSAMLTFKYNVSYNYSDADYKVYEWEQEANMFNPDYDPTSSNIYNSGYLTQNIGPGLMYSIASKLQLNVNLSYQSSSLLNEQEIPVITPSDQQYSFENFIYSAMLRKTIDRTNSLRFMLRSYTENPSVSELQEVVKDSNPLSVSSGNSLLEPSYTHSLRATYIRSSVNKGRTFMAMLNGSYVQNSINDSTVLLLNADDTFTLPNGEELEQYGEYTKPVNLDGEWSVGASTSFGTPVNLIASNVNIDFGYNYKVTPSVLNDVEIINTTSTYKGGISIGSNISQYVDFTVAYNGSYNVAEYQDDIASVISKNNEYLTHKASLQFKFQFWGGITLTSTSTYSQYKGITDDFNEEYLLCNIYLGKKLFKNQRGEISIGVNDLLDQTESFTRNITESYVENVRSNSIGRYYGIKFTFDLRKFNGQMPQRGERPSREGGGMMGPPDGGGGGGMRGGMGGGPGGGMGGGGF